MKKFKGFTLSEVMISLTIISVIMLFYIPVHKTVARQYTTLGYAAFETLNALSQELMSGHFVEESGTNIHATILDDSGRQIFNTTDSEFCKNFFDAMNTVGTPNCSSFLNVSKQTAGNPLTYKLASINVDSPNAYTTNGHRYYLSSHQAQDDNVSTEYGYRVIGIDMTGKKKPNLADPYPNAPGNRPADLIYFILLDDGRVFPIGIAATSRDYINARMDAYFYDETPADAHAHLATGCSNAGTYTEYQNNQRQNATSGGGTGVCGFGIASPLNPVDNTSTYDYRKAYCFKNGDDTDFKGYGCTAAGYSKYTYCPPGGVASECQIKLIKPLYRVKI